MQKLLGRYPRLMYYLVVAMSLALASGAGKKFGSQVDRGMPSNAQPSDKKNTPSHQVDSGVSPMTKLLSRNKYAYSLFVLAVLTLASGAGLKWGQ